MFYALNVLVSILAFVMYSTDADSMQLSNKSLSNVIETHKEDNKTLQEA